MDTPTLVYGAAYRVACDYLSRWEDDYTRGLSEDLAQETAFEAWQRHSTIRDWRCLSAYVRTISRRLRSRVAKHRRRIDARSLWDLAEGDSPAVAEPARDSVRVEGRWHDKDDVLACLRTELSATGTLNACLVRGYYEGFSCVELALRYGLGEESVKVRLYRCRHRIRRGVLLRIRSGAAAPTSAEDRAL